MIKITDIRIIFLKQQILTMRSITGGEALSMLYGCASSSADFDRYAADLSLVRNDLVGGGYQVAVYDKSPSQSADQLHVYIGSDGTPWNGSRPSVDPTPRHPLGLKLMSVDPVRSVYIGRPCYHQRDTENSCDPRLWTSARYSDDIVDSMAAVIDEYRHQIGNPPVTLFGYSGGGTIAVLLATRLAYVSGVVTVGANLDTDAWTRHFSYLPLVDSINPSDLPALPALIRQLHLHGGRDAVVPAFRQSNDFVTSTRRPRFSYIQSSTMSAAGSRSGRKS